MGCILVIRSILALAFLTGCVGIVSKLDKENYSKVFKAPGDRPLTIFATANVHGETKPCGCRVQQLGGILQMGALMRQLSTGKTPFLVDLGDLFFKSITAEDPEIAWLTAQAIAKSYRKLGVRIFVPGERDFAMGEEKFSDLVNLMGAKILLTNASKEGETFFSPLRFFKLTSGSRTLFLFGLANPKHFMEKQQRLLINPSKALALAFEAAKTDSDWKDASKIILSHLGHDEDQQLARDYPWADAILGAHDRAFLQRETKVGKTLIGATLDRNHHLMALEIGADGPSKYSLNPTHRYYDILWKDHPAKPILDNYDKEVAKIQKARELAKMDDYEKTVAKEWKTRRPELAVSCKSCHSTQYDFWSKTAHAHAMHTLVGKNAHYDTSCIQCHSVRIGRANDGKDHADLVAPVENAKDYWKDIEALIAKDFSARNATASELEVLKNKELKIDQKHELSAKAQHVQCLNCHTQHPDHPLGPIRPKNLRAVKKTTCLACHTDDQSPSWYPDGIPQHAWNKVACPKG